MPEKTTQKEHGKKTAPPSEKEVQPEVVIQIPLAELHPFPDHPFQVRDDDSMRETAESVKAYGVLVPAIVRPREEGGYEIIAGHRRKHACELAELATMPAIVRNMDRDTATIIMVDSNLQRENILPSERAKAYKMKMDAIKRQGARTDLTSPNISAKFRSDDEIGQEAGVSGDTIRNYISLTQLVPELQQIPARWRTAEIHSHGHPWCRLHPRRSPRGNCRRKGTHAPETPDRNSGTGEARRESAGGHSGKIAGGQRCRLCALGNSV